MCADFLLRLLADVKLTYLDRRYEFSVSLHQLGVLLLFNNVDVLTLKDIKEHTRLSDAEVSKLLVYTYGIILKLLGSQCILFSHFLAVSRSRSIYSWARRNYR